MKALFSEIRERLEGQPTAAAIGATLSKVRSEIERKRADKAQHEAATIDLLADHADVMAADRALAEAILTERRLVEAERLLGVRHFVKTEEEVEAARTEAWNNAIAIRDAAFDEISRAWRAHANGFAALVSYIKETDAKIAAACDVPPRGCEPIGSVMQGIYSYGPVRNVTKPIVDHLSIPGVPGWDSPDVHGGGVTRG